MILDHFHKQTQLKTGYLTLFKVLRFNSFSYESTFLLDLEDFSDIEIIKDLLYAKKIEEISKMAFEWLTRNVSNIKEKQWEQRYSLLDKLMLVRYPLLKYKNDEKGLKVIWNDLIDTFVEQENKLTNAKRSKDLVGTLEIIKEMVPTIKELDNAISNFNNFSLDEKSKKLYQDINDYYECLEQEMKYEQINVSYGKDLILFLQSQLLAKRVHKYNQNQGKIEKFYDWILYQEYIHYAVSLQLCLFIKELLRYDDSIIYKEFKNEMEANNREDCPFWNTKRLIDDANKLERKRVGNVYLDKYKKDTINERHLLNQYVRNFNKEVNMYD
jgi:hypothetical protein